MSDEQIRAKDSDRSHRTELFVDYDGDIEAGPAQDHKDEKDLQS